MWHATLRVPSIIIIIIINIYLHIITRIIQSHNYNYNTCISVDSRSEYLYSYIPISYYSIIILLYNTYIYYNTVAVIEKEKKIVCAHNRTSFWGGNASLEEIVTVTIYVWVGRQVRIPTHVQERFNDTLIWKIKHEM